MNNCEWEDLYLYASFQVGLSWKLSFFAQKPHLKNGKKLFFHRTRCIGHAGVRPLALEVGAWVHLNVRKFPFSFSFWVLFSLKLVLWHIIEFLHIVMCYEASWIFINCFPEYSCAALLCRFAWFFIELY